MELKILDYLIEHGGHTSYGDILNTFSPILETAGFCGPLKREILSPEILNLFPMFLLHWKVVPII